MASTSRNMRRRAISAVTELRMRAMVLSQRMAGMAVGSHELMKWS